MLRGYHLADLFTLANACAGTGAILSLISFLVTPEPWRVYLAFGLLFLAFVCDVTDGYIARWRHTPSSFGRELDSLADIISFGLAPAIAGYSMGLRGGLDILFLVFFVGCGISRLARFNITAVELADEQGKVRYFEGLPIPSSLLLVLVLTLCFALELVGDHLLLGVVTLGWYNWHPLSLLYFANGCAMISKTLRIPKW